jgi:hypothetical protein
MGHSFRAGECATLEHFSAEIGYKTVIYNSQRKKAVGVYRRKLWLSCLRLWEMSEHLFWFAYISYTEVIRIRRNRVFWTRYLVHNTKQISWSCNTSELYSDGAWFDSCPRQLPSWLGFLVVSFSESRQMLGRHLLLGHNHCLLIHCWLIFLWLDAAGSQTLKGGDNLFSECSPAQLMYLALGPSLVLLWLFVFQSGIQFKCLL